MKLFHSDASPYARKVVASAHELGLADEIEIVSGGASPVAYNRDIGPHNPSGRIPTLVTGDGLAIYDSRVICEYLDLRGAGGRIVPRDGMERIATLTLNALADGIMEAALLMRYEVTLRPEALRWQDWADGQWHKITASIAALDRDWTDHLTARTDLGSIATGCALGYLDFRFADRDWRGAAPKLAAWFESFAARPSMQASAPRG